MDQSGPARTLFDALAAAEPAAAAMTLDQLSARLKNQGEDGLDLGTLRGAYLQLLHRRGYFVDTPEALARSLLEIASIGPGFDLYELSRSLAQYDALHADCLHRSPARALPELRTFHPRCGCGNHGKEP